MKTKTMFFLGILSILYAGDTFAQEKDSVITLPSVTVTSISKVNSAVDKAFRKSFPQAKKPRWYKLNKDYLANFIKEDMKHQTLFQRNGFIKYDVSYGYMHNLPESINTQVEGTYTGYNIMRVAKVTRYDQEFWIINLEGIKDFVVVRAENGDLEEVKRLTKSEPVTNN